MFSTKDGEKCAKNIEHIFAFETGKMQSTKKQGEKN